MRHLPERVKHYFVIICTLVMVRTIYLQGAVFAVVISWCAYRVRGCGLLSSLNFVATTRARESRQLVDRGVKR